MGAVGKFFKDTFDWGSGLGTAIGLSSGGPLGAVLGYFAGSEIDKMLDTSDTSSSSSCGSGICQASLGDDNSDSKKDSGEQSTSSENVGGDGSADSMIASNSLKAKGSFVGAGSPTFGFTENVGTGSTRTLGA